MLKFVQNFPFFTILLCLSGGVICSVLKPKAAKNYCLVLMSVVGAMSAATLAFTIKANASYRYMMGHFPAPWGNEIRVGVLESLMATVFCVVMVLSLLGGMEHIFEDCEKNKTNLYFTMVCLLMSSLLALIYTNDLFTAYVFVEINTIASCALVMLKYKAGKTLVSTTKYLIMSLLGSGLFLIGITLLYDLTGHLLMENIAASVANLVASGQYMLPLTVIVCLFSMGMAIKSALFPFHSWLPDAHGNATSSSSAILSGLVLKGYTFLLIKLFYRVFSAQVIAQSKAANVLFVFGAGAMIVGSLKALREKDIKRMLAYSSVAQMGYIYLGLGLGTEVGITAACVHILVHAITKPMLFCCAGSFMTVSGGHKKMKMIYGAGRRDKLAGVAFTVGAMSMIGIPFFAGFVSKFYLSTSAIANASGKTVVALAVIIISTVLNAMYYIPAVGTIFGHTRPDQADYVTKRKYTLGYTVSLVIFIAMNLYMGSFSNSFLHLVQKGLSMFGM